MSTRDLPDMYAQGPQAQGLRAYISGKSRVHMLQVICSTSGTLKFCPNLTSTFPPVYIVMGTRNCGAIPLLILLRTFQTTALSALPKEKFTMPRS